MPYQGFTQQCRQREPSVKSLSFSLPAKFWKLCFLEWRSNPQPVAFTVALCAPAPRLARHYIYFILKANLYYSIFVTVRSIAL